MKVGEMKVEVEITGGKYCDGCKLLNTDHDVCLWKDSYQNAELKYMGKFQWLKHPDCPSLKEKK